MSGAFYRVGSQWQLFIDDFMVSRSTGLDRVVHHPKNKGIVIPADRPWETVGLSLQHVYRKADGTFEAYYQAMWFDPQIANQDTAHKTDRAHHIATAGALAVSSDGIHWEKPNLGLMDGPAGIDWSMAPYPKPAGATKENNLGVPFIPIADLGRDGNVSDPNRQFALRLSPPGKNGIGCNWQYSPKGYFAPGVPDFRNDPDWYARLIDSGGTFDPRRHHVHYWDANHEEWAAIEQGVVGNWLPSREIARFGSKDLIKWTGESVLYPDAKDSHSLDCYDEPMGMVPFCGEGVVFGLLSWFHSDRSHPDAGPQLNPTPEHPNRWPWCRKGTNEMRITVSRDGGFTWDRTSSREAWISHGTEEDSFDRLVITPTPPVHVGDEDWFYIGVINGDHLSIRNDAEQTTYYHDRCPQHQIALYVQKHHRYVSLGAKSRTEVLISRPVVLEGDQLQLNVDASRGEVRVGIASAEPFDAHDGQAKLRAPHLLENRLLEGFSFEDCEPIRSNRIEETVRFAKKPISSLKDKPVYLLFKLSNADLYGFRAV